jgi:superfamily II DNA or RNA helicase
VAGYENVFYVHSQMSKDERESQLSGFHNSTDGIMCNCGILTTGYDHPAIECIILFRATLSLPLYLQMCGRGSRTFDNKPNFIILDFGGNIDRFGKWQDSKDWIDFFNNPPKKIEGVAPTKECPECEALLHLKVTECPYCGHIFEVKEKKFFEGELIEVEPLPEHLKNKKVKDLTLKELHEVRNIRKWSLSFTYRILLAKGMEHVINYGKLNNYKPGWHRFQKGEPITNNFFIK